MKLLDIILTAKTALIRAKGCTGLNLKDHCVYVIIIHLSLPWHYIGQWFCITRDIGITLDQNK